MVTYSQSAKSVDFFEKVEGERKYLYLAGAPARALSWHSASLLARGGDEVGVR